MMKPTTIERQSLLTCVNDDDNGKGLDEGFGAVANYCEKKSSPSNLWSPLEIIDSLVVAPFETDRSKSSYEEGCAKENATSNETNAPRNSFVNNADIQQLAKQSLLICTPSKVGGKARVSPMKEYIASFYNDRESVRTSQQLAAGAKKSQGTALQQHQQQQQQQQQQRTPLSEKSQVVLTKQQQRTPLSSKAKVVGGSGSKGLRVSPVPDEKFAFQDKENIEGNNRRSNNDTKKKINTKNNLNKNNDNSDNDGNLRSKLVKSQKRISGLQAELKRKDEELLASQNVADEKVKELNDMSEIMTSLQDLLEEMGCNVGAIEKLDADNAGVVANTRDDDDDVDEKNSGLEVASKEREHEWKITRLVEALGSQEYVMESLKNLNDDYEKTTSSMMQLIYEKDEAIAQIEQDTKMNEHANQKIMMHIQQQHQKSMDEVGMRHQQQIAELLESLTNQTNLINSLKCLTVDSSNTIASLTCLIDEKDKALAAFSHFNEMNNDANRKLLAHANQKHQEEMLDREMHTKNLHLVIRSQLKEKVIRHEELALLKLRMEEGTNELKEQYLEETKFIMVSLAILAVLMALVWQRHEWLLVVSPVYFLFVFWKLG